MSSAKTIADIYSFSELLDNKSFIGNPFTSQPMYIAACAFLMESAFYASPDSKSGISPQPLLANQSSGFVMPDAGMPHGSEQKSIGATQHNLLANIAKDNYQRCYKALKAIEMYWDGTKYILTVLDQKAKGIVNPLLYTADEMGDTSSNFQPLGISGRQQESSPSGTMLDPRSENMAGVTSSDGRSLHKFDPGQGKTILSAIQLMDTLAKDRHVAIGWALTNAANHHNPNLSVLYQNPSGHANPAPNKQMYSSQYSHSYPSLPTQPGTVPGSSSYSRSVEHPQHTESIQSPPIPSTTGVSTSNASLLMGLGAPYSDTNARDPSAHASSAYNQNLDGSRIGTGTSPFPYQMPPSTNDQQASNPHMVPRTTEYHPMPGSCAGDVLIESQNIDMNMLQHPEQFPFAFNGDNLPWLEYLPPDVASLLGEHPPDLNG